MRFKFRTCILAPVPQPTRSGTRIDLSVLASAIDESRAVENLSLRALAKKLGLAASTLTRIRQGHRPDADALAVLLAYTGLPARELLIGAHVSATDRSSLLSDPRLRLEIASSRKVRSRSTRPKAGS